MIPIGCIIFGADDGTDDDGIWTKLVIREPFLDKQKTINLPEAERRALIHQLEKMIVGMKTGWLAK